MTLAIHVLSIALCLSSGFQQGYIASVLNQPYDHIISYINATTLERTGTVMSEGTLNIIWSSLNVMFPISTIIGQFVAGWMCRAFGRKRTALIASTMYIPGALISTFSKWFGIYEFLFIGRIIWSIANGINSVNATVWIVECAPPRIRGRMAAMQEFFMAIGSLLAQAAAVPLTTPELWHYVFVPNVFIVLLSLLMFVFVYESPQYIMEKMGDEQKARRALAAYHGVGINDASLEAELRICEGALQKKKSMGKIGETDGELSGNTIMFCPWKANDSISKVVRHAAWLGIMVKIAYVFTGARCLRSYSTFILRMGGMSEEGSIYGSVVSGVLRVPITLVPVFLVDHIGRRPLMIFSTGASFLSLLAMMAGIDLGSSWQYVTFTGLTVLLLVNACGIGSVSRFYSAELVPRHLLLSSVSSLTMFEALTKIAVEFAFYPLANEIGTTSLLIFLVPTAIFMVLMWALCPETSRRSVNEVLNEIAQRKKLRVSFPM